MTTITRSHVINRFINIVINQANSGISWGTNAVPFPKFPGWYHFGGTTQGIPFTGTEEIINPNTIDASDVYDKLIAQTQTYTRIRMITAQRNVIGNGTNGSGAGTGLNYNATAIANMTVGVGSIAGSISDPINRYGVKNSSPAADLPIDNLMIGLWNSYQAAARSSPTQLIKVDVCHANCHDDCHSSRGRR